MYLKHLGKQFQKLAEKSGWIPVGIGFFLGLSAGLILGAF